MSSFCLVDDCLVLFSFLFEAEETSEKSFFLDAEACVDDDDFRFFFFFVLETEEEAVSDLEIAFEDDLDFFEFGLASPADGAAEASSEVDGAFLFVDFFFFFVSGFAEEGVVDITAEDSVVANDPDISDTLLLAWLVIVG